MQMTIRVTKGDIADARAMYKSYTDTMSGNVPRSIQASNCPVVLALKRAFKTGDVFLDHSKIVVKDMAFELPPEVDDFIDRFDDNPDNHVEPFQFKLDVKKRGK